MVKNLGDSGEGCRSMNEIKMSVSQLVKGKDGKKTIFVEFSDGQRRAEGRIPGFTIISNKGFSPEETEALEEYLRKNEKEIIRMSKDINVLKNFMDG